MGNARKTTVRLLTKLENNSSYSNILLDDGLKNSDLSPQDKKFASALFYGVLERRLTLDEIINSHLNKPSDKISAEVRNILRVGLYQLIFMDSVPDSAAVDECVKLAKKNRNPAVAGFVNGLLRAFIREDKKLPVRKTKVERLSLEYSCPLWLVQKWLNEYGEKTALALLQTSIGQAPISVKANTLKMPLEDIISALQSDGFGCEIIPYAEDCLKICGTGSVEYTDAYKNGLIHVQDLSSQLCCAALCPQQGDTVFDICAAPGGKSFTIAELMKNKGEVYSFDLHENRVRLIRKGSERLGLTIIKAETNDGKKFNENMPMADKVLCDVPCSGLGVIRRKPEIKYKKPEDFENLPKVQYDILDMSSRYVKTGGTLIYSTCTCSKAENDAVADKFLKNHPEFCCAALPQDIFGNNEFKVTITPDKFGSDGFFIAKFVRLR